VLRLEEDPDPDRVHFPGGQPVSLDRGNLGQLRARHYMVTWKADGTRYMLLLCSWGTYLIDRAYSVRRVQVRRLGCLHSPHYSLT
jgi:mRNA-capping enzyme